MSKSTKVYIKLQVPGGAATPAGSLGPALGSKGVNIMEFCKQFNARTQDKKGDVLPVLITVNTDKSFSFVVKTPPVASMIMKTVNIKKGSSEPNRNKIGEITSEQVKHIAEVKMPDLNAFTLSAATKMVAGTARSMGIIVRKT